MNKRYITMRLIIILFFSLFSVLQLSAQSAKIVVNETINGNGGNLGKSYLIVNGLTLQNFKWTASTHGSFYARMADPNIENRHPNLDKNFIKTEDLQVSGHTSVTTLVGLPVNQKLATYQYIDDVGRPDQTVAVQTSPGKLDAVSFTNFNSYGQQINEYLPYAISGGKGAYRSGPTTEAAGFYLNTPLIGNDSKPYKKNDFDKPGGPFKVTGAGSDWHTAGKAVETKVIVNPNNTFWIWKYNGRNHLALGSPNPPTLNGKYAVVLQGVQTTDEQGQKKQSFKNFKDQVVLERVGDGTNWFDTYYVYDLRGNLFCVIPPEASEKLDTPANYETASNTTKQTFLDDWAFQYDYDDYGRMIGKKVPGAEWVLMVYDKWDRVVLTQDGKQRLTNQWTFTKYDEYNRAIITGFHTLSGNQAAAQLAVTNFGGTRYETHATNALGYSLGNTYPANPTEANLLTVTYYDDYRFRDNAGWDAEGRSYSFVSENNIPSSFCTVKSPNTYCTVLGQTTGSKIRIVGTSTWLNSITYYDNKYRVIQTITENHLGGTDRVSNELDAFTGRTKKTLRTHTSTGNSLTVLEEYDYDHIGRPINTWQTLDGGSKILVSSLKYNELGEVIEKNLHSANQGGNFLQSVDYRYNVRGWLTSINNSGLANDGSKNNDDGDLFGMELLYNQQETIEGANSPQMWNGNIGAIKWQSKNLIDASKEKAYRFNYDVLNRLSSANYATKSSTTFTGDAGAYNTTLSYSKNGNIQNLTRTGLISGSVQTIDNLSYVYGSGNRLNYVIDNSNYKQFGARAQGFVDQAPASTYDDYIYDGNGNATQDNNRSVDITYNHLNMPTRVEYDPSNYITYSYDALGSKLQQKVFKNGSLLVQRDYVGGAHFEGGSLKFLNNTEGRALKSGTGWQYEYQLRDHQGNTMATFGSLKDASVYTATMEVENADKEVIESTDPASHDFYNINITNRSANFNHTVANAQLPTPNESVLTNANIGPGKLLSNVNTGDRVKMSIYARYASGSGSLVDVLSGMLAVTTSTFGIGSGEAAYGGFSNHLTSGLNTVTNDGTTPKAYLNYFLFNNTFSSYQFGFYPMPSGAALDFTKLEMDITIPAGYSNGYMYIYATNESNYNVYFDDMYVLHERTNPVLQVTQLSDYYPFGVSFNEWNKQSVTPNRYLYQGQEMQDDIDYLEYQYKFRTHDPTIGRFMSVDPLAEDYKYNSTYAFSENRVIDGIDLEGKEWTRTIEYQPAPLRNGGGRFIEHYNVHFNVVNNSNMSDAFIMGQIDFAKPFVESAFSSPHKDVVDYSFGQLKSNYFDPIKTTISYDLITREQAVNSDYTMVFGNGLQDVNGELLEGASTYAGLTNSIGNMKSNKIFMNVDYFQKTGFFPYTLTHEIGHAAGLTHFDRQYGNHNPFASDPLRAPDKRILYNVMWDSGDRGDLLNYFNLPNNNFFYFNYDQISWIRYQYNTYGGY